MGFPPAQGLYDPRNEHDACGVGFIANIKGVKSHTTIERGLQILVNLDHRGAVGADPLLGDGAGILIQIPDALYRDWAKGAGVNLPQPGDYTMINLGTTPTLQMIGVNALGQLVLLDAMGMMTGAEPVVLAENVVQLQVVYGLDDGVFVCLDPDTGERRWKAGRFGHGQLILVGRRLLLQTEQGEVLIVEPNPERLIEVARFQALEGKTWNPPAFAAPILLVRSDLEAAAYELPARR